MSPQNANNTISALFRLLALVLNWCVISRQPPKNIGFIIIASIYLILINMPSLTILMPYLKVHVSPIKNKKLGNTQLQPRCASVLPNTLRLPVLSCWFDHSLVIVMIFITSILNEQFSILKWFFIGFVSFILGPTAVFWLCADRRSWIEI